MGENPSRADDAMVLDLDECGVGAFAVDVERRIVAWNPAAEALLGYRAEEVLGRRCSEVLGADPRAHGVVGSATCANCPLSPSAQGRRPANFELRVTTRSGAGRWISVGTMQARTVKGAQRIIHLFRDVTAYHALDDSLRRMRQPPAVVAGSAGGRPRGAEERAGARGLPEPLTAREAEALRLLSRGLGTREIAEALSISRITARNHVTRVMEKLGANSRLQAVVIAARQGLL